MTPDATLILQLIATVLLDPMRIVGGFVAALILITFLIFLLRGLLDNARSTYQR